MTRIVAVCGSRRDGSTTKVALEHALDAAAETGCAVDLLDLGAVNLPLYHPDRDEQGESADLKRRVRDADGLILGSPVYHGSYSSTLKNFHDYCSWDEYEDTVVGLLATAGGGSYGSTLDHMRITVRGVHGFVVPHQVGIRHASDVISNGEVGDVAIRDRLETLGRSVAEGVERFADRREPAAADD